MVYFRFLNEQMLEKSLKNTILINIGAFLLVLILELLSG